MPMKKMTVIRVEYETKDRTQWKAVIIAYNTPDAIDYIRRNVKDFDRYTATTIIGDVDGVDYKVMQDYLVKTEVVETVIHQSTPERVVDEDPSLSCPWCEKEFKTKQTLGTHIKKFHV